MTMTYDFVLCVNTIHMNFDKWANNIVLDFKFNHATCTPESIL